MTNGNNEEHTNELNNSLLQQARNARHVQDQSKAIPWHYAKRMDFNLSCTPKTALQGLVEKLLKEIEESEERKKQRSDDDRIQLRKVIKAFLLNLIAIQNLDTDKVIDLKVSLDSSTYDKDSNAFKEYAGTSYTSFIHTYEGLHKLGYIETTFKGHYNQNTGLGERTQICATEKLKTKFSNIAEIEITFPPLNLTVSNMIVLKDENKRRIKFESDSDVKSMLRSLKKINLALLKSDIRLKIPKAKRKQFFNKMLQKSEQSQKQNSEYEKQLPFVDTTQNYLYRIFNNGTFEQGGRFYGGWWQNVLRDYRKFITIDGSKVTELDYSSLHGVIAYDHIGKTAPKNCYQPIEEIPRKVGKLTFNALLNSRNLFINPIEEFEELEQGHYIWEQFKDAVIQHNSSVSHLFGTGIGLKFQRKDSDMAEAIMLELIDKGIVALPLHDSFIVKEGDRDTLYSTMKEVASRYIDSPVEIDIKY